MKTKLLTLLALHLGLAAMVAQPVITNQPQNQTAIAGTNVTFSMGATGAPPLTYQWRAYLNLNQFTNIPGETNAALMLTNVQPTSQRFAVVVTDGANLLVTSRLAQLTVVFPPSIIQQPASRFAEVGDAVAISVTATGTPPLSYQWLFNGQTFAGQTRSNLTWTSVQLSNAGNYLVIVTNIAGSITSQVVRLAVGPPIFTRVTNGPISTDSGYSWACAWADYNNDGWIDLMVANEYDPSIGQTQTSALYLNQRNGNFVRVTNSVTTVAGPSIGLAWADFDNDGQLDLFVANATRQTNFLFQSTGNGGFTRITEGPIVTERSRFHGGTWGDFDNDGLVDLFVVSFRSTDEPFTGPNFLYHNLGDGHFSRVVFDAVAPTNRTTSSSSVT